jgi:hypothetical protein
MLKNLVSIFNKTERVVIKNIKWLRLFKETAAVYPENQTRNTNTNCGPSVMTEHFRSVSVGMTT